MSDEWKPPFRRDDSLGKRAMWGTIDGDTTIGRETAEVRFLITDDCVITIDETGLTDAWEVLFVPDDSKDNTSYTITLAFSDGGQTIDNLTTIKGVCSISKTHIAGLYAPAGAIE